MRADDWKKLFKEKGWLQGNRLIQPKGCNLTIYFSEGQVSLSYYGEDEVAVEVTETFLKVSTPNSGMLIEDFYLWEDIERVTLSVVSRK